MPHATPWLDRGTLPADMALGQRWGRLRIVGYEVRGQGRQQRRLVTCVCLCGAIRTVQASDLRTGHTHSCGCLARESVTALWAAVHGGERQLRPWGRPRKPRPEAA